jgi:3-hydroxyisobutyrate dehydrogenase-like beta-hydroxyacid dehydrogenase
MLESKVKIAVIGIGYMGSAVAELFAQNGHEVTVWNRTREKAEALLSKGIKSISKTPAEAIAEADYVWISLSVFSVMKDVLMTEEVRKVLADKHIMTQTATRPSQILEFQRFVTAANGFLSEVATIGQPMMMHHKMAIMVYSGKEFEIWQPILAIFSNEEILHQGEVGGASHLEMSLLVNGWTWVYAVFFPLANLARQGLELGPALHILQNSLLYKMPGYVWWGERVKNRSYDDVQFTVETALSHVDETIEYLKEIGSPTALLELFRKYVAKAVELGYGKKDGAAIFEAMVACPSP